MASEKKSVFSWSMYDWANSAFTTVIITFVYSVFFERGIIGDAERGSALWAYAIGLSGLLIALCSPVIGAVADHYGARKHWLAPLVGITALASVALWFGQSGDDSWGNVVFILAMVVIANCALELSIVINNAMLPDIAEPSRIGRISGWAWGLGYVGGLSCLVVALFGLVGLGDIKPLITLPQEGDAHLRAMGPLVALWLVLFSLPLFFFTRDVPRTGLKFLQAVGAGLRQLGDTISRASQYKNLVRFLIASMLYRDGLNTLFTVGGLYAAGTFGLGFEEILIFAIGLNISAGLGAALFAFMDDRLGSKPTILWSLAGLMVFGCAILLVQDKVIFIALACVLGLFMGPVQAASRTLAARLTPPGMVTQTYGLYALTGKSISFLGPLCFAWVTLAFDSQRMGMATIVLFWLVGFMILLAVKERRNNADQNA